MTLSTLKLRRTEIQNLISRAQSMSFAPGTPESMKRTIIDSAVKRHSAALKRINADIRKIMTPPTPKAKVVQLNPVLPADFKLRA